MLRNTLGCALALALLVASPVIAEQAAPAAGGIKRTPLQKLDVPGTSYETVTALAEIPPATNAGRHTHPGPETGYLLEGAMTILVDGRPPLAIKAGDSYQIPAGTPHDVRTEAAPVKVLDVYIVEKGKPLASPAP